MDFTPLLLLAQRAGEGEAAAGIFGLFCMCFAVLFGLAAFAFWIWMLIDCVKNESSEGNDKLIWILVIVLLQGLGALIYFFARRPARRRQLGQ